MKKTGNKDRRLHWVRIGSKTLPFCKRCSDLNVRDGGVRGQVYDAKLEDQVRCFGCNELLGV